MKRTALILIALLFIVFLAEGQTPVQTVRGVVKDASTRETLPNANVIIENEGIGTVTNVDGRFKMDDVPVGRHTLKVSYLGYEPAVVSELVVGSGKEVVLEIEMEESYSELKEVEIKSSIRKDQPINSMASVSARTFSVKKPVAMPALWMTPGGWPVTLRGFPRPG